MSIYNYAEVYAKKPDQLGNDVFLANPFLSVFAYYTLYIKLSKKSLNIQCGTRDDGSTYIWTVGKEKNIYNNTVIPLYGRFYCTNIIA